MPKLSVIRDCLLYEKERQASLKEIADRLGRELADVAKLYGSGGIMHSDELPGYGVKDELEPLKEMLKPRAADRISAYFTRCTVNILIFIFNFASRLRG